MFTGLVEKVGALAEISAHGTGRRIRIRHAAWDAPLVRGESVAVQGSCLTVVECRAGEFECDLLDETMLRTNLSSKRPGAMLNLERALRVGDRFGGHMVAGHIDGIGTVSWEMAGRDRMLHVRCARELMAFVVEKGSIACDGISLTVARVSDETFDAGIIPETWNRTSLRELTVGGTINIETDVIAKHVVRLMRGWTNPPGITAQTILDAGFV